MIVCNETLLPAGPLLPDAERFDCFGNLIKTFFKKQGSFCGP